MFLSMNPSFTLAVFPNKKSAVLPKVLGMNHHGPVEESIIVRGSHIMAVFKYKLACSLNTVLYTWKSMFLSVNPPFTLVVFPNKNSAVLPKVFGMNHQDPVKEPFFRGVTLWPLKVGLLLEYSLFNI